DATCITAATDDAVYRRPDGIVIIDPEKAKGQKDIVSGCPYRVIYWNEALNIPQKCTMCAHLLDQGWKEPRCVEACPTGALVFGDLDDPKSDISLLKASQEAEALHAEFNLNPAVTYIGLPKRFIAGEVVLSDQPGECAEGIDVTLISGGQKMSVQTDNFGDFEFDGLENDDPYAIEIFQGGYAPKTFDVRTKVDVNLGTVVLEKENRL
ncbi:MAG: oxidoreductase, partial [Deltaproteobacteria bacterium]|nr:oxidoreductase [Deltaproteobacteria bacterium]